VLQLLVGRDAPSIGRPAGIRLAVDVGVLVLVTQVEAKVVHHVAGVLKDLRALCELASGGG
jgi:hypothetical protein